MKFTKLALVLAVPMLAVLFVGQNVRPPKAEARPTELLVINWTMCLTLNSELDWDGDGNPGTTSDKQVALFQCQNDLDNEQVLDNAVGAIRGLPQLERYPLEDPPTPEDFTTVHESPVGNPLTAMDSDLNQIHQVDGVSWVIAFVSNDDPVAFYADRGRFQNPTNQALLDSSIACGPVVGPDYDFTEADCDGDNATIGDGVVVVGLAANGAARGDAVVRVRQGGLEMEDDYTVVGEPYRLEVTASKTAIQTGDMPCELFKNTSMYLDTLASPQKSPINAKVTDSDGLVITGALVKWEIDSGDVEDVAMSGHDFLGDHIFATPTVSSALGVNAPNVICGDENPGDITIKASITKLLKIIPGPVEGDSAARERSVEVEMKVQGPPTEMVLSASPSGLVCDGTATSAVSATLKDAEGNLAVNGNTVSFSVRALGTVSPIEAASADGVATTTVTPLTDVARGVTVNATLLVAKLDEGDDDIPSQFDEDDVEILVPTDDENLQKAFLVECTGGAPQAPGQAPVGTSGPSISPPATGDGGYLGAD